MSLECLENEEESAINSQQFFAKFVRDTRSKVEQKKSVLNATMQEKLPEWKSRGVLYSNKAKEASMEWSRKGKEAVDRWKKERSANYSIQTDESCVFGMQLELAVMLTRIEPEDFVPCVFRRCIDYLDRIGIYEVGIYRIPGSTLTVNRLKDEFNYGADINFEETNPDPHVVATLLKLYLRELPETVIPFEYTQEFRIIWEEKEMKLPPCTLRTVQDILAKLPKSNFCLLKLLCHHLRRVADNEPQNKMSVSNLSLIFIPTLNIERGLFNYLVEHYRSVFVKPAGPVNISPPPLPQKPRNLQLDTKSASSKKNMHSKTRSDTDMHSKIPPPKPSKSPQTTVNRSRLPPPLPPPKPRSKSVSSVSVQNLDSDKSAWKSHGRVEAIGKQFEVLLKKK